MRQQGRLWEAEPGEVNSGDGVKTRAQRARQSEKGEADLGVEAATEARWQRRKEGESETEAGQTQRQEGEMQMRVGERDTGAGARQR